MKIIWNGTSVSQERNEGYKVAEDEIHGRLVGKGMDIERTCLIPSDIQDLSLLGIEYQSSASINIEADVFINNRLPLDYTVSNKYNIGFSYWETSKLPSDWVSRMNQMDEIWTTSLWAKNVFEESGVTVPVFNFRLGVNKLFSPKRRFASFVDNKFTFLCIGSPSTRKNTQMTVDAFIKIFSGDESIRLLYKSIDAPDARWYKSGEMLAIEKHPQIDVIDKDVSMEELSNIYDLCDCVVYPTSGEGWGMLPYQGIAKGIPTICTNATACTEYAELSVPLEFEDSSINMNGIYSDCGTWAKPKFDDLCAKMLYVYNNYDVVSDYTFNNAVLNEQTMSWDSAAEGYYERLCQISKELKKP